MLNAALASSDLARRLPWLLVFRAGVATALLGLTLAADLSGAAPQHLSLLSYGVVIGTYVIVAGLGLLLRARVSPALISGVHLGTAILATLLVVQGTGGADSVLSFLYLLVILDAAIIGAGRGAALVAGTCSMVYGAQLAAQLYGVTPGPESALSPQAFATTAFAHLASFVLMALTAGYLAELLQRAREAAASAETDLLRAERLHAAVLEALPIGVLSCNEQRRVTSANAAAARLLSLPMRDLLGAVLPQPLVALLDGLVRSGETVAERQLELGGGTRHVVLARSSLGQATQRQEVLVLEDRTHFKALERDLMDKERLASVGQLAAAIAHEIRNPLAAISGSVELMTQPKLAPAQAQELRAIVLREIHRLNLMVQDFLLYARPAPLEKVEVDVVQLAEDVSAVLRHDEACRGHALNVRGEGPRTAAVDPSQLRQVLWNLLRNALEASPEGTPVDILVAGDERELRLEVSDRGPGLAAEIKKHLFEPFRTTKPNGSGLGLATVHRIVQAHRGRIDARAGAGGGTTFHVVLPRGPA